MKNITKIIISGVVLAFFLYLLVSMQVKQEISSGISSPEFMMELSGVRLRGWNKEKVAWEMIANQAYYYDKNTLVLLGVNDGWFLNEKGDNLIEAMSVSTVNANIIRKEFVLNELRFNLKTEADESIVLQADTFRYSDGVFDSENKYLLRVGEWQISSGKLSFDVNKGVFLFSNKVNINKGKNVINSETGIYYVESNSIKLKGDVAIDYFIVEKGSEYELFVQSDESDILLTEGEPEVSFVNGLITLGEDVLQAEYGKYDPDKKNMQMKDAIIRVNDGAKVLNNIDSKELLGSLIKAKVMDIDFQNKKVQLSGQVVYERNKRKILANRALYDVEKGLLVMHDNVEIVDGNKIIKSNDVDIDVKNDVIVAKGNVKTKLKI